MKISRLVIHNFRSIADVNLLVSDYVVLVGENNTGKTSLITALRMFWEDGGVKFDPETDLPKFERDDDESWLEIRFQTTQSEQEALKKEYRSPDGILRVRRYFHSSRSDLVRTNQSNIYAYEGGALSTNLFYGARNISQAKLGMVIYIPEVTKADDALKLTGPSPFRQMVNFVMRTAVQKSESYGQLTAAFDTFNASFKKESSKNGFSVKALVAEINADIAHWGIQFGVDVNSIAPEDIVKNLLTHFVEDQALNNVRVNLSSFGQGLQRSLIYTLIRLAPSFVDVTPPTRKEFSPAFTLILFDEPEAFLHPSQQGRMNVSLRSLSKDPETQVLISTHSPHFVSKNIDHLPSLVRLDKLSAHTSAHQISPEDIGSLLDEAQSLRKGLANLLTDAQSPKPIKDKIIEKKLAGTVIDPEQAAQEEAIRYFLWLNPDRASLFFARHVIICEGQSDKALLDCLIDDYWPDLRERQIHVVDSLGKFCIHRYMTLLSAFGISHSVIMDRDKDQDIHKIVNDFIDQHRTSYTHAIFAFPFNIETFIGVDAPLRDDLKAVHLVSCLRQNRIPPEKIDELRKVILSILP
jgi:putative ATP-dependent endonuclease of OLD family